MTTALDATASGVYVVASTVDAGLNAKSELIVAATQGLLRLASRVPLVGQIAGALQDLFKVYQVSCTGTPAPVKVQVNFKLILLCTGASNCTPPPAHRA